MANNSAAIVEAISPQSVALTNDNNDVTCTLPRKDREAFVAFAEDALNKLSEGNPNREKVFTSAYKFTQSALVLAHALSMGQKGRIIKRRRPKQRRQKKDQLLALAPLTTSPQTPSVRGDGFYAFVMKLITPEVKGAEGGPLKPGHVQKVTSGVLKDPLRRIGYAHQYIKHEDFKKLSEDKMHVFFQDVTNSQGFQDLSPEKQARVRQDIDKVLRDVGGEV